MEIFRRRFLTGASQAPEWKDVGRDLRGADGAALALGARGARSHAETVVRHVRRALFAELELETGSLENAEDELATLLAILETAV